MSNDERTTHFGFRTVAESDKVNHVRRVFDTVVNQYDLMNDLMSLGLHRLMKAYTVELSAVRMGDRVLDLAGGTADIAARIAPLVGDDGEVVLCDINESMLQLGRDRLLDRGLISNVRYVQADAEHLPFPADSFDAVTIGFGLRNFTRIDVALRAIFDVLKPGGRLLVLEFSTPKHSPIRTAYRAYTALWPKVGSLVTGDADSYRYLVESIRVHPDQETLLAMISDAGFVEARYYNLMDGIVAIHVATKP